MVGQIPGRVLESDDGLVFGELRNRLHRKVVPGQPGDVVQEDGEGRIVGDGRVEVEQAVLGRAEVVRGDDDRRVRSRVRGGVDVLAHGFDARVAAAGEHRRPVGARGHGLYHPLALRGGQARKLADGAAREQPVHPAVEEEVGVVFQCGHVHVPRPPVDRRGHGYDCSR